ncbi:hypothetical protein DFH09DRAFT_1209453 [Mycena vulgaris]|nr:hypothetical protein DFH09DRAFT_1209453 [Mycena vulgaris]
MLPLKPLPSIFVVVGLLCGLVHAAATNHTLDDTSPAVVYTQTPFLRCTPTTCEAAWTERLFNGTSAITSSPIIVSFTGTAVYVYLGIAGACIFNIDGVKTGVFNDTIPGDENVIHLAYRGTGMADGPHTLTIYPAKAGSFVQFDYVVYTTGSARKSRVGAIVGGVVGGVVFVAVLSAAAFFVRRRERQKRLSTRGIPLGDHWPDKPSIKLVQMSAQK